MLFVSTSTSCATTSELLMQSYVKIMSYPNFLAIISKKSVLPSRAGHVKLLKNHHWSAMIVTLKMRYKGSNIFSVGQINHH